MRRSSGLAQQPQLALHLVESHRPVTARKHLRVAPGGIEHIEIVECGIAPCARDEPSEKVLLPV